jgi:hypothetical protein
VVADGAMGGVMKESKSTKPEKHHQAQRRQNPKAAIFSKRAVGVVYTSVGLQKKKDFCRRMSKQLLLLSVSVFHWYSALLSREN